MSKENASTIGWDREDAAGGSERGIEIICTSDERKTGVQ
jgi:hypothetical protein